MRSRTATEAATETGTETPSQLYLLGHQRIVDLVRSSGDRLTEVAVPACPPWTVHDLLSHLAGVCADVLAGNLAGVATDGWTAAQVDARRDRPTEDVIGEWIDLAPRFAALVDGFPGWYPSQPVADVTLHEHDLRAALGRPDHEPSVALIGTVDFLLCTRAHPAALCSGAWPIRVVADGRQWVIGTGARPPGDLPAVIDGIMLDAARPAQDADAPAITLTATAFELSRALSGRRSAEQIRRLDWSGDPSPFLPLFGAPPFTLRSTDLDE